jgi:hypothetical protein
MRILRERARRGELSSVSTPSGVADDDRAAAEADDVVPRDHVRRAESRERPARAEALEHTDPADDESGQSQIPLPQIRADVVHMPERFAGLGLDSYSEQV